MSKIPISVIIPTLNEESRIRACIDSVRWAAEVIVIDGGSEDRTVEVAKQWGARVLTATDMTIGAGRNVAIESASHQWVLAIDADEVAEPEVEDAASRVVDDNPRGNFSLRRRNFFEGREIRGGGWGNDRVVRLFPRTERYDTRRVHEKLQSSLPVTHLVVGLRHVPYENVSDFEEKLERYSAWGAADLVDSGRSFFGLASWIRPPARAFRMFLLQLGFIDGMRGLKLAWMAARSVRQKYLLAREMVRTRHR